MAQVTAILTAIMTVDDAIIVIDEINSFLHPSAVKALLRIIQTYNGRSPAQKSVRVSLACTDPRSIYDGCRCTSATTGTTSVTTSRSFASCPTPGSGNDVTLIETLPRDPAALPDGRDPRSDITHWFDYRWRRGSRWRSATPTPTRSILQAAERHERADMRERRRAAAALVPRGAVLPTGIGAVHRQHQCDNTHWCASLHINDLECSSGSSTATRTPWSRRTSGSSSATCPTGPAGPQLANSVVHAEREGAADEPRRPAQGAHLGCELAGGGRALERRLDDLTTGKSGFMLASAENGFMQRRSRTARSSRSTTSPSTPPPESQHRPLGGARDQLSTQYEIGHFKPCTSVTTPCRSRWGSFPTPSGRTAPARMSRRRCPTGSPTRRSAMRPAGPRASRTAARRRPTRWRAASRPSRRTATWTSTARPTGPTGRAGRRPTTGRRPSCRCSRRHAGPRRYPAHPVPRRTRRRQDAPASPPAPAARCLLRAAPGSSTRGGRRPR